MQEFAELEPSYSAWLYFRLGEYDNCAQKCTEMLKMNPDDKLSWATKIVALTEEIKVLNDNESSENLEEELFVSNQIQTTTRPGTSKKCMKKKGDNFNPNGPSMRPQTGNRPLSGFAKPATQTRPGTGLATLATPKTSMQGMATARPTTGKNRRADLQTAQVYAQNDTNEAFLQLSRINLEKYATDDYLSKILFEHIFSVHQEYRSALTLAEYADDHRKGKDAFWKFGLALCNMRMGMIRKAEEHTQAYINLSSLSVGAVLLSQIYEKIDQPITAIKALRVGLKNNHDDLILLSNLARLEESRGSFDESANIYEKVLQLDPSNREALCTMAANKFYDNDPVRSFSLYRRVLQSGTVCSATYNNIALSASALGQTDVAFRCFLLALNATEDDEEVEMVWYNIGNVALQIGEFLLAERCYKISIAAADGGMALNNLGVLSSLNNHKLQASSLLKQAEAAQLGWEALWNCGLLSHEEGDEQRAYEYVKKSMDANPEDKQSKDLYEQISHKLKLI